MKKENGITVITLVITIVILLILATISIILSINGGVIGKSIKAKDVNEISNEEEAIEFAYTKYMDQKELGNDNPTLNISDAVIEENEEDGWNIIFNNTKNEYTLSETGEINGPFTMAQWDETATSQDCFIWASDDPSSEDYGTVIGYKAGVKDCTELKFPSRTKKIQYEYIKERYNNLDVSQSVLFTKNIKKIEVPKTVTEVSFGYKYNLDQCFPNVEEVILPKSVVSIGDNSFYKCTKLSTINIPQKLNTIGHRAFYKCSSLDNIELPKTLTNVGNSVFYQCTSLKNITIEEGSTILGSSEFEDCTAIQNITLPSTLETINSRVFNGCTGLSNIIIPNSVTALGASVFSGCTNLTSVTIPDSITEIKSNLFADCTKLNNVTIPNTVTKIGTYAFDDCTKINNIKIPESVVQMDQEVFKGWTNTQTIKIVAQTKPEEWNTYWNRYCYANIVWGYTSN